MNGTYIQEKTCQIPTLSAMLQMYLGWRPNGYFVDIGCYDGRTGSNTAGLADIGWAGLMVDAVAEHVEAARAAFPGNPRVQFVNYAVGDRTEPVDIRIGGQSTTANEEFYQKLLLGKAARHFTGEIRQVPMVRADDLLSDYKVPCKLDVMSIDVEGSEMRVLGGLTIEHWRPRLVIIEAHEQYTKPDRLILAGKINNYFILHRYMKIYSDISNNVYFRQWN